MSRRFLIFFLLVINAALFYYWLYPQKSVENFPEVAEIDGKENFKELKSYFTKLANKKGAPYAYEILKRVNVAPGTDMHLMGHIVGEILYQQKGAEGMRFCTQDFRNACSHTIVVGLFSEKGLAALPEISEACEEAPGGKGAYTMCFHGLGHGILAYTGYDLPKTVAICQKVPRKEGDNELAQCVSGAIMEIISGGDHDRALWEPKNKEYMGRADPLYPCNSDIIPDSAKRMCYSYLTPHLFVAAGASLASPAEEHFKKAFTFCLALNNSDPNRQTCFAGFGKEFVVLAKNRDIRNINLLTRNELEKIEKWCGLAEIREGIIACEASAVDSMYWGGENDFKPAVSFCGILKDPLQKDACFTHLIRIVDYFSTNKQKDREFCNDLPDSFRKSCEDTIES